MKRGTIGLVLVLAMLATTGFALECTVQFAEFGEEPMIAMGPMKGAYLGVRTQDVTTDRLAALKLREETGVEITMVDQDAPAGKAGIREHDVILTFNGTRVESEEQLRRLVRETPPGRNVALVISRGGQTMNFQVTLGDRKAMMKAHAKRTPMRMDMPELAMGPMAPIPPIPPMDFDVPDVKVFVQSSSRGGLLVETLTPQLAEFFGVKQGGVLIRSVEKGSVGEAAGLKAGDVIVRANKDKIDDVNDWRRVLRTGSGTIGVTVVRDKREQTVQMKVPERKRVESGSLIEDGEFEFNAEQFRKDFERIRPQIEREREKAMMIAQRYNLDRERIQRDVRRAMQDVREALDVAEWD